MTPVNGKATRLGWAGTGRMGYALASRLLEAGHDVAVYNRTRAKAEPLAERGATIVDTPADLADRDIVFTMVAGPNDFTEVLLGPAGILSADRPWSSTAPPCRPRRARRSVWRRTSSA